MNDNFYKSIIKDSPMGYAYHKIICDEEGKPCDYEFLEINSAFEEYTGLRANDIIGKKVTEVLPDIEKSEFFDWIGIYGDIALNDGVEEFDQFSEPLNKYYRIKAFSPEKGYFATLFYDITEEKIAKQKEINFKKLFDNMQSGAAIYRVINDGKYGKDYIIKDFNKESLRIEGKTKEDVIGKSLFDLRPNIDEYGLIDVFREVWKTGESKKYPSKVYVDDKYNNYYENEVFKLGENEIVAIYNDVTQIMQTQEELKESTNKFKQYIDKAPYGVFVADENGKYLEVNEEACNLTGFTKEELLTMDIRKITEAKDHEKAFKSFQIVKNKGFNEVDLHFVTKENEVREWNSRVVKLNEKRYLRYSVDITDKKELENKLINSENSYKQLFSNMFDAFAIREPVYDDEEKLAGYKLILANKMFNKTFGDIISSEIYIYEPCINKNVICRNAYERVAKTGVSEQFTTFCPVTEKYFEISVYSLGKDRLATIHKDITDQREALISSKSNEDRLNRAQEIAKVGTWELEIDATSIWASNGTFKIFGLKPDRSQISVEEIEEMVHADDKEMVYNALVNFLEKKDDYDIEYRIITVDTGEEKIVTSKAVLSYDEKGKPVKILGVIKDVTEYRRAQADLVARDAKYDAMISNISDVISILDKTGFVIYQSPNIKKWFGWSAEDRLNRNGFELVHKDDVERIKLDFSAVLEQFGITKTIEFRYLCKDGNYKHVKMTAKNLLDDPNINGILLNYHDITERVEKEKNFEMMIKTAMDGFLLFDLKANILDANDYYCKLIGYTREELLTMSLVDLKVFEENDDLEKLIYKAINESPMRSESKHRHKNGTIIDVEISSNYLPGSSQFFVFLHDLTEEKRLEEEKRQRDAQQVQQQRLESIGTLAGGVAHEINNPINGIMNYGQLILDSSETTGENAEYAKEIIFESERVATIVKNLLQFSRQEKQEHSYANIKDVIEQTLSLIKAVMRHDQIDLQVDIPEGLPELKCRSQQIQQVIMNLLTNARDALNEKYKGYHENKIVKLTCEQFNKQNHKWIRVTVEDHGTGIPKSVQKRLFEPFFTTKDRDKGTGLGLPISYGIVKDHHGELTFETKKGSFTRFYLELPCDNGWELEGEKDFLT